MKVNYKMWFENDSNKKFFGKGTYILLKEIEKTNSLNKASKNLKMSYSKAFNVIKSSEKNSGIQLIKTEIGGVNGGGSNLTDQAYELMNKYEEALGVFEKNSTNFEISSSKKILNDL